MAEQQLEAKVVLLGDSGVGKTSIAVRYVQGVFAEDQPSTIGASFFTKRLFGIIIFVLSSLFYGYFQFFNPLFPFCLGLLMTTR